MTSEEIRAAAWTTLGRVAAKEARRDVLPAGTQYPVELQLTGKVDGQAFVTKVSANTSVGHDSLRVTSHGPDVAHLVAYLLSRMNRRTREVIIRELPERFARAENRLPPVDHALVEAAEGLLKRLRSKLQQPVRGPVSTTYRLGE